MAAALEYTYRYSHASAAGNGRLQLVTSLDHPTGLFFEGRLLHPQRTAELLLGITHVVRSRFHVPAAMLGRILIEADPVITCHSDCIRFEGFSSCAGVYSRLDLDRDAVDGEILNRGTTNVDFNPEMRAALAAIRAADPVRLSIGAGAVEVATPAASVIERRVKLPLRWLRSFSEVGLYQARMQPWLEISGAELRRFISELPAEGKGEYWLAKPGLRLSMRPSGDALPLGGIARLRVLKPLARDVSSACIYSGDGGSSAWELQMPGSRFHLVLSADVWRGFSGEGQALALLASKATSAEVAELRAQLRWQGTVTGANERALARCAASGLLGYDLHQRAWFHRELPFQVERIAQMNPRLKAARELAAAVEIESRAESAQASVQAWVPSNGAEHRVVWSANPSCTCPWFNKHGLDRGPCKHILAVQMRMEANA